jgi:hypothetical protein
LLQVNYTTGFAPRAKARSNFAALQASSENSNADLRFKNRRSNKRLAAHQGAPYMTAGSSIIPVGRGMDISKLPIGSYRLDVQATDSTGKSAAWRSANFTVER